MPDPRTRGQRRRRHRIRRAEPLETVSPRTEVGNMFGVTMASEQSSADVGNHNDARVDALDELSPSDFCQGG